jgi:hypothetical protein
MDQLPSRSSHLCCRRGGCCYNFMDGCFHFVLDDSGDFLLGKAIVSGWLKLGIRRLSAS